ncbi:alpha-galactosidase [Enterococcus sp. DIV0421]|uniref:alpha-galactosidase n=1 Tax=Enterococcus sp. DIV0421 TaxID=2774688 RepID=UPI003F25B2E7
MVAEILYDSQSRVFHISNSVMSYLIQVDGNGKILQLYFGEKICLSGNFKHLVEKSKRPMSIYETTDDEFYSYEHIKQEIPESGSSDFRIPAIKVRQSNGDYSMDLKYYSYRIFNGKNKIEKLPHSYVSVSDEACTLELKLKDAHSGLIVNLYYSVFSDRSVIARSIELVNSGKENLMIERLMPLNLDLPTSDYEIIHLSGAWGRERHIKKNSLHSGMQSFGSTRGHSSHNHNPFFILKKEKADEYNGECIGFSFVYSGDFTSCIEVDSYSTTRVQLGMNSETFCWKLKPGEHFHSPEVIITHSSKGLSDLSYTLHSFINENIINGYWKKRERPVKINSWEAFYFDFDEEKLLTFANKAKELGVELFVLDDGWFGDRSSDDKSLGDWIVNREKFPNGLDKLVSSIRSIGLGFGIWIEPEMVNPNSRLYREHPDWILKFPNKKPKLGRNQYVLNFGNIDVVNYIFDSLCEVFDKVQVDYIKWDMNRSILDSYDSELLYDEQGEVRHRYIIGVYRLYKMISQKYPKILIESCASGGGRFDLGMLYYASQTWTSDCTDAIERLKIQYGTSLAYPLSSMGAHVSVSPNHQNNRMVSLKTRIETAYFGNFGLELDPNKLSEYEKLLLREGIEFYKKNRYTFQYGRFFRLSSPFENNDTVWMVISEDRNHGIGSSYKVLNEINHSYKRIKLKGLHPEKKYRVKFSIKSPFNNLIYTGDELMKIGLSLSDASSGQHYDKIGYDQSEDFSSILFYIDVNE